MARELFIWQARSFTVRIALSLVDRINWILADPRTPQSFESGGILLGRVLGQRNIEVTGFEPIFSQHHRGIIFGLGLREIEVVAKRSVRLSRHAGIRPVGFFRTHLRRGLFLDQDDFSLMTEAFSDPFQIAMLVRPLRPGPANAGIFIWEDGDIDRRSSAQLFPFDSGVLRAQGPLEATQSVAAAPRKLTLPTISKPAIGWSIAAVASLVLAAEGASYIKATRIEKQSAISQHALWEPPRIVPSAPLQAEPAHADHDAWPTRTEPAALHAEVTVDPAEPLNPEPPKTFAQTKPTVVASAMAHPAAASNTREATGPDPILREPPARELAGEAAPVARAERTPAPSPVGEPSTPKPLPVQAAVIPRPAAPPAKRVSVLVSLESKRGGHHIPLIGRLPFHSDNPADFSPPRPNGSIEPRVPELLADELANPVTVDVKLSIDKDGLVRNAQAMNGHGSELSSLAADTAQSSTWEPAREGDKSVSSDVIIHYLFRPRD